MEKYYLLFNPWLTSDLLKRFSITAKDQNEERVV